LLGLIALDTVMEVEAMGRAKLLLSWWPEGERERERERERTPTRIHPSILLPPGDQAFHIWAFGGISVLNYNRSLRHPTHLPQHCP
jgi:hypothetical protein